MQIYFLIVTFTLLQTLILSKPTSETDDIGIINGYDVDITAVPYQAILTWTTAQEPICAAVIIGEKVLLTAAHCVYSNKTRYVITEVTERKLGGKKYLVEKRYIHEDFKIRPTRNDIAILFTKDKIEINNKAKPIKIAPEDIDLPGGTESLVSGFGQIEDGSKPDHLKAANVTVVDQAICAKKYKELANITEGMICAEGVNPPRSACYGDSGGPLVAKNYVIGIVSWGVNCADPNFPAIYARVSRFNSWIRKKIAENV